MVRWAVPAAVVAAAGCAGPPAAPARLSLVVTHHAGGVCERTIVRGPRCYQTVAATLLVTDAGTGRVVAAVELGALGSSGAVVDLAEHAGRLYAVIEDDEVLELDLADPDRPRVAARTGAAELGLSPRLLSVAGGDLYVSGQGGVARWSPYEIVLSRDAECGRVAMSADGPVACIGRRVYRLGDGSYVGSASDLQALPDEFGLPGVLVFVREGAESVAVGLMRDDIREVDTETATVRVPGPVRRVRAFAGRIWVVTDRSITAYAASETALLETLVLPIAGARDVCRLGGDRLAVGGAFGRAVARWSGGPLEAVTLEPGGLDRALFDGRYVLAAGPAGSWLYDPGRAATPSRREVAAAPAARTAVALGARAEVGDDGRTVIIETAGGPLTVAGLPPIQCLASVGGALWIGHDRGITVTGFDGVALGELRLAGPVRYLFPLSGGDGAAWVAEAGGLGTARFMDGRTPGR